MHDQERLLSCGSDFGVELDYSNVGLGALFSMDKRPAPLQAKLRVPAWLSGGNPRQLLADAHLHSRKIDTEHGIWAVQTEESYLHNRARLVTVSELAGPGARQDFDRLQYLHDWIDPESLQELGREIERRIAAEPTGIVDAFNRYQLLMTSSPVEQLSDVVEMVYTELRETGMEGDPTDKVFRNAAVHLIQRAPAVHWRIKLSSVWLRIDYDPKLGGGDVEHLHSQPSAGMAFASSQALYDGIYTFDAYLGPLLGALSPAFWGFSAPRSFGVIFFSLGQPLAGTLGEPAELLQGLATQGATQAVSVPTLTSRASSDAISWWIEALNDLFAVLTDLAVFTDTQGFYVPTRHLHALLTVEQLFRRVISIQAAHRDHNARRVLFFSVLDTLERLTGRPLEKHCSLAFARKTLQGLKDRLPPTAAEVLLPAAERAITALREVQDGFFIQRNLRTVNVELYAEEKLSPERAAAEYIKLLRNATHGHGSNRKGIEERTNALLAHHDGSVPHDLGLLGYVYLLDLLSRCDDLRRTLHRRATAGTT